MNQPDLEALHEKYFQYVCGDELKSERFLACSPQQRDELIHHAQLRCRAALDRLLAAIDSKDPGSLRLQVHAGNKFFRQVFEAVAGRKLGATGREISSVLRDYCGSDAWDKFFAQREVERQRKAEQEAAKNREFELRAVLGQRMQWHAFNPAGDFAGGLARQGTVGEFIADTIANGFEPLETKQVFATTVTLRKRFPDGRERSYSPLRTKIECDYARQQFAERQASANDKLVEKGNAAHESTRAGCPT